MVKKNLFLILIIICCKNSIASNDTLSYSLFGKIVVYKSSEPPENLILFVSGDGGWNSGVENMAKKCVNQTTYVVGVDIRKYINALQNLKSKCCYPAGDFENLSKFIQKKYCFKKYNQPILIGYSSGATLVYGTLAQAPANTFKGALALGFCPDIEISKPFCKGSGLESVKRIKGKGYDLQPMPDLSAPFISLQGKSDKVCGYDSTVFFLQKIKNAQVITLEKVGHGYSVEKNWIPQFLNAVGKLLLSPLIESDIAKTTIKINETEIADLPLTTIPSEKKDTVLPFAIMISGDGGWTGFDQALADELAGRGIPVAGLNALKYFWEEHMPLETAADIFKMINYFSMKWEKQKFLLVGYSFGADILPFIMSELPKSVKENSAGVVMLSPSPKADFEIHVTDLFNIGSAADTFDVKNEIEKLKDVKILCIYGSDEEERVTENLPDEICKSVIVPGGHHYENNYSLLSEKIFEFIK